MKFILEANIIIYSIKVFQWENVIIFNLHHLRLMIFISIMKYVNLQINLLDLDENQGILSGKLSFSSHNILPHHQLIC